MTNENKELTITLTGLEIRQIEEKYEMWKEDRESLRIDVLQQHEHLNEMCEECWDRFEEKSIQQKLDWKDLYQIFGGISRMEQYSLSNLNSTVEEFRRMKERLNKKIKSLLSSIVIEGTRTKEDGNSQTT